MGVWVEQKRSPVGGRTVRLERMRGGEEDGRVYRVSVDGRGYMTGGLNEMDRRYRELRNSTESELRERWGR